MPKILVSDRANVVMPYHKLLDRYEEERLGKAGFGSTKSGMAPCYSDRYAKIGFQVNELFNDETLKEKIHRVAELKNVLLENLYNKPLIDEKELYDENLQSKLEKCQEADLRSDRLFLYYTQMDIVYT